METIECIHIEHMKTGENHTEIGICQNCGQTVIYDRLNLKSKPTLTKLGRIDGKIVLPKDGFNLDLNGKDQADLTLARMEAASAKHPLAAEEATEDIPPRPAGDPVAQREWYKKYKKRLIDELVGLGEKVFREKYPIPRQLLSHLKTDKYYKKLAAETPPAPAAEPKAAKTKPGRPKEAASALPQLPAWNDNWAPEVQLLWLRIYEKLVK